MAFDSLVDSSLARWSARNSTRKSDGVLCTRNVITPAGSVRIYDSGADLGTSQPCVLIVPDGPNVIEHYDTLICLLEPHVRVVCFDMPGFGYSLPQASYTHALDQGAQAALGVMDALQIDTATLAFSCANGFYALRAAQMAPQRITRLVLSQTPSLTAMHGWTSRVVPWPLRVPVLGQLLGWLFKRKAAHSWYHIALPRNTDAAPYQEKTLNAFNSGACFCLAGVVQGLAREVPASLHGVTTPCTLVWGALDHSHKHTQPQSFLDCAAQADLVRFDDCGHFPDIEQPERFAALLLQKITASAQRPPSGQHHNGEIGQ
jgi:pimeloyl-ACP methyl ester carboxylesterase